MHGVGGSGDGQRDESHRSLLSRLFGSLSSPGLTRWLWLLPLVASLPAVATGYVLDDLQQQSMVRGTYDGMQRSPSELYCFSLGPGRGIDPAILSWWDDPGSRLCLLRPISSWTLWIDHTWLWRWPALPHLHSILWFVALWLAWRAILMRYLPLRVANLALLLTAVSGAVAMTVGWIASRHALVGGALGIAGLYSCLASRDDRATTHERRAARDQGAAAPAARAERSAFSVRAGTSVREVFGWALIGLGLLSSEMVLGIFGFLVAREWLTRTREGRFRPGSLLRIAGYAACGLLYVASHARLGYGAPKYPLYLNASGDPATFLRAVPERLLALSGDLVLGLPSDLWVYPDLSLWLGLVSAIGVVTLVVACMRVWPLLQHEALSPLRWLCLGGLLSMAPALSGMQGGRALTLAAFPAYALIATYLLSWSGFLTQAGVAGAGVKVVSPLRRGAQDRLGTFVYATLVMGVLIGNPSAHFAWFGVLASLDRVGEKSLLVERVSCQPDADVYLIDASDLGATAWYARYWLKDKLQARNYHQLTMSPLGFHSIRMRRTGPSSLTMHSTGGPLVGEMAIPPGTQDFFHVGLTRQYEDYSVVVRAVTERGPTELDFQFARTLDDPQMCIFVQDDAHLYQLDPPPVGTDSVIEPVSPMSLLSGV